MYQLKSHEFEDLEKFRSFVDHIKNKEGHIELKVRAMYDHDACPSDLKVGSVITEETIHRFVYSEIYYLDECENYPEYVFVCANGTIIVAQDMLHYGVY